MHHLRFYGSCIFLWMISSSIIGQTLPWPAESPFMDSYGYTWKTNSSSTGPTFDWIDITAVGNEVIGLADDNTIGPISIGMDFPYYWVMRNQIWVGDNGYMSFSSPIPIASGTDGFPPTPSQDAIDDVIAPYMADMNAGGNNNSGKVYTWFDSLNQRFVLSYIDFPYFAGNANGHVGSNTFQVILDGSDSTITFQYLSMQGSWEPSYNNTSFPFVVGIENHTGNIGLMPTGVPTNSTLKPIDSTAIRFYPPISPNTDLTDLAITWVQNEDNGGFFIPWASSSSGYSSQQKIVAQISNEALADVSTSIYVEAEITDPNANDAVVYHDSTQLAYLKKGENRYLIFPGVFSPPQSGIYELSVKITNANDFGDINGTNNENSVAAVALDSTLETQTMSYLRLIPGGSLSFYNFPGAGVYMKPYGHPMEVVALEYFTAQASGTVTNGFFARLYGESSDKSHIPGPLLFEKQVIAADISLPGWTRVDLTNPVRIDSGGFYVGWRRIDPLLRLTTESQPPYSRHNFDILDSAWVTSRNNENAELLIRAIVRSDGAIPTVPIDPVLPASIDVVIFPNPAKETIHWETYGLESMPIVIRLINENGQKVFWKQYPAGNLKKGSIDISEFPLGKYFLEVVTENQRNVSPLLIIR